jgi:hypothetical protein
VLSQTAAVKADSYYAPCIFVKLASTHNEGLAVGGLDKTYYDIKVTAFVRTEAELIALGSVIRDLKNTATFVLNDTPLNEFNDLKARPWSFASKMGEMAGLGQPKIIIEDSYFNPLKSDVLTTKFPNVFIGVGTFKVFVARYPRQ